MKNKKKNPKIRAGSIVLIASLLIGSATLRIGLSATEAMAKTDPKHPPEMQKSETKPAAAEAVITDTSTLLAAIREREKRVAEQELKLELRGKSLSVAQHEIERRIEALQLAEERLRATLARANTAAEDDVARLTTVYENMKPKDGAALFEAMEPGFAAGFLARMRPDAAAAIMSGLSPEFAYTISVILAGRNAKAPKS